MQVGVPPLQKVGCAPESVLTGEARHPQWRDEVALCGDIPTGVWSQRV